MRSLLTTFLAAVTAHFVLVPTSAEAAVITSITGHVTGIAYSQGYAYGTNVYGREGMSYDETLAPGATSLSAQASNNSYAGAYSNSSLSFTPSSTELAFSTAVSSYWVPGLPNSSADVSATLKFDVNFTLTEATTVSLTFDFDFMSGNQAFYQIDARNMAQARVTLAQVSGVDPAQLYVRTTGGAPIDSDGDGIFYASALLPGDYRFTIDSYSTIGNAFANGALHFSPVPEPASALLIALGLASFLRRRRAIA